MAFARARGNAGSPPNMVYSPPSPGEERAAPPLAAGRILCGREGRAKSGTPGMCASPAKAPIASATKRPRERRCPPSGTRSGASPGSRGVGARRQRTGLSRARSRANPRCPRSPSGRCCAPARWQNAQDSWGRRPLGPCPTSLRRRRAATPPRLQSDCG